MDWGFYGRQLELEQLRAILQRKRWFFVKLSGRRRIGKTTLIQQALWVTRTRCSIFQIPDSGPAGVLSAVRDAFETFAIAPTVTPFPTTLSELATTIGTLARVGYIVVLDEFQYFHRKVLSEFTSHLQREVDRLSSDAGNVPGGLFVLGSIHTELTALLDDRDAPLYNRVTDTIEVGHLDVASVLEILRAHADDDPARLPDAVEPVRGRAEVLSRLLRAGRARSVVRPSCCSACSSRARRRCETRPTTGSSTSSAVGTTSS